MLVVSSAGTQPLPLESLHEFGNARRQIGHLRLKAGDFSGDIQPGLSRLEQPPYDAVQAVGLPGVAVAAATGTPGDSTAVPESGEAEHFPCHCVRPGDLVRASTRRFLGAETEGDAGAVDHVVHYECGNDLAPQG